MTSQNFKNTKKIENEFGIPEEFFGFLVVVGLFFWITLGLVALNKFVPANEKYNKPYQGTRYK